MKNQAPGELKLTVFWVLLYLILKTVCSNTFLISPLDFLRIWTIMWLEIANRVA